MREGAACSPVLWAVYADGLLLVLRQSGLGCYIAGKWVGAVLYADDLSLIAPTRAILASMLALVEAYGAKLNLTFSSCQDPGKCKSFCLYFVGMKSPRKVVYPSPLVLNGVQLPWRESAVHLGHTLHQNLKSDADAGVRRAAFIARSVEVRSQFSFAPPPSSAHCCQNSLLSRIWGNALAAEVNPCGLLLQGLQQLCQARVWAPP